MSINKAPWKPKPWQIITGSYTAKAGDRLILKPQTPTVITVPATPGLGTEVTIIRVGPIASIQFNLQGQSLNGNSAPSVSYTSEKVDTLVYVDNTTGWTALNGLIF
jgi:hypothetical protein